VIAQAFIFPFLILSALSNISSYLASISSRLPSSAFSRRDAPVAGTITKAPPLLDDELLRPRGLPLACFPNGLLERDDPADICRRATNSRRFVTLPRHAWRSAVFRFSSLFLFARCIGDTLSHGSMHLVECCWHVLIPCFCIPLATPNLMGPVVHDRATAPWHTTGTVGTGIVGAWYKSRSPPTGHCSSLAFFLFSLTCGLPLGPLGCSSDFCLESNF
jgi:hypothetical protein